MTLRVFHITAGEISRMIEDYYRCAKIESTLDIDLSESKFIRANVNLNELVELVIDLPVKEAIKATDTLVENISNEPEFRIDDIVILKPKTDAAAAFLRQHGYVWKVAQASATKWYLNNCLHKSSKQFAGKTKSQTVLDLLKDRTANVNQYEVVCVTSFPEEFIPRKAWNELILKYGSEDKLVEELRLS